MVEALRGRRSMMLVAAPSLGVLVCVAMSGGAKCSPGASEAVFASDARVLGVGGVPGGPGPPGSSG